MSDHALELLVVTNIVLEMLPSEFIQQLMAETVVGNCNSVVLGRDG